MQQQMKIVVMGVAICSLLVASVYALETLGHYDVKLPGLDKHGNLDHKLGGHARAKLTWDTHTREWCIRAYPVVQNHSHHKHTFYDVHAPRLRPLAQRLKIDPRRLSVTKDIYYVDEPDWFSHEAHARAVCCGYLDRPL